MSTIAEGIHHEGETSGGRRALLRELDQLGPRTVPDMARARPVSRQYIRTLVNGLAADGYVERVENPRHRRSQLVRLTPAGRRRVRQMQQREGALFASTRFSVAKSRLQTAATTLRAVRTFFEAQPWSSPGDEQ